MGATYTRQSTFTDGDVIDSDLFNNEFDQLLAAFASSTGHTHDGTAGEGGPVTALVTDGVVFGTNTGCPLNPSDAADESLLINNRVHRNIAKEPKHRR